MLGLSTGPVCVASCGPALLPWLLAQPQGLGRQSRQLAFFLVARLAAYLLFAAAVWYIAGFVRGSWSGRSWLVGATQVLLAVTLLVYAAGWPHRRCIRSEASSPLVQIGAAQSERHSGAFALGFLTGLNLCPPFLVAGVRAAQLASLSSSLLFFGAFFVGTTVWFVPFLSLGVVKRTPAVVTVARMVAVLLACWYGYSGGMILIERTFYGI